MKESFYIPHDLDARNDLKILRLWAKYNAEGYGFYWMLVEILGQNGGKIEFVDIPGIAESKKIDNQKLTDFITFCLSENCRLFKGDKESFWSVRVNKHLEQRKVFSEAGKLGALKRWGHKKDGPPNSPPYSNKEVRKEGNKDSGHEMTSEEQKKYLEPENINNLKRIFKDMIALKNHLLGLQFPEAEIDQAIGKKL